MFNAEDEELQDYFDGIRYDFFSQEILPEQRVIRVINEDQDLVAELTFIDGEDHGTGLINDYYNGGVVLLTCPVSSSALLF